MKIDFYYRGN